MAGRKGSGIDNIIPEDLRDVMSKGQRQILSQAVDKEKCLEEIRRCYPRHRKEVA